jgi:hypothetical protein
VLSVLAYLLRSRERGVVNRFESYAQAEMALVESRGKKSFDPTPILVRCPPLRD